MKVVINHNRFIRSKLFNYERTKLYKSQSTRYMKIQLNFFKVLWEQRWYREWRGSKNKNYEERRHRFVRQKRIWKVFNHRSEPLSCSRENVFCKNCQNHWKRPAIGHFDSKTVYCRPTDLTKKGSIKPVCTD